jgi:hypothetical protein
MEALGKKEEGRVFVGCVAINNHAALNRQSNGDAPSEACGNKPKTCFVAQFLINGINSALL